MTNITQQQLLGMCNLCIPILVAAQQDSDLPINLRVKCVDAETGLLKMQIKLLAIQLEENQKGSSI